MKVTDLMLGDWVKIIHHHKPKPLIKVKKIDLNDFCDALLQVYPEITYEPIPITPEILEKNEFHAYSDMSQEWFIGVFKDGNKYLELTYSKGDIDWTINGDEYCIAPIKYVHELQHALKLCEIEKEIIL